MDSSNSRNHSKQQVEEEEEDDEYEEIEVEEEVEVEEEEFEEVEVEEEVEEEIEEEVDDDEVAEEEDDSKKVEDEEEEEEEEPELNDEEEEEEEEPELNDEEEYEEVEEEEYEEVEVEEEVTDDDEEEEDATMADADCDDQGEEEIKDFAIGVAESDLSPIRTFADNVCEDSSQHMEPEGDEVCLRSGDSSFVKTEASIHDVEVFCTDEGTLLPELQNGDRKGISSIDVGSAKTSKLLEHITGPQSDAENYEQDHVEQESLVFASEKYISASDAASDYQLGKQDTTDVEESKSPLEEADLHLPSRQSVDQKESRSWFPQVRLRSASPGAEREDGNKRAARICEFFSKGWCIKGSSCKFLHKRDNVDNATQVGDTLPHKSDLQPYKGSGDNAYASELLVYKGSSSTAGKDIQKEHGEGLNLPQNDDKDETGLLERVVPPSLVSADSQKPSSRKDGSRSISNPRELADVSEKSHSSDNHGLAVAEGGSMLHNNFLPWRDFSLRELGLASSSSSILRLIEESAAMRRRYSLDIQSPVPSYHISSWKNNSLLHKSPLSSGSDSAKFSGTSYAQDQLTSFKYETTFTPYKWEPSVPFRSSYFISPVNRSSDVQYDPFRDSIGQPDVARPSFRDSSYSQTQDVHSLSGRNSIELHKELQFDNWDKNYSFHGKVVPEVEAESAATSASGAQNKMVEEENPTIPGSVKDILKASRSINDGSSKVHSDWLRFGEVKVEKGLNDEESKTIKIFRASLIEFVKELMKPLWHGGQLSKDVYKVIVQKAEDKILSTLQPSQVPSSSEAIKQYLSLSRPKIMKLIQAYVDKYGRF